MAPDRTTSTIVRPRGSKVDRVEVAREIATSIGDMLTNKEPFAR